MSEKFKLIPHIEDTDLPAGLYAQTALADIDNDGRLEFITGQQYGTIFYYKFKSPNDWSRRILGHDSASDVGGCAIDVDGDGWVDFITGGAWYRNSCDQKKPFERFVFDENLTAVHDLFAADLNGDGRLEIITMSEQNNLRFYTIPTDPTQEWVRTDIGPAVHAGTSVGDINGNGHLDLVRTDVWYENVHGDGSEWVSHHIGFNTAPPSDFQPYFAYYATYNKVCDMNGNGTNDIIFLDNEIPGGKVWWMENISGDGTTWKRQDIFTPRSDEPRRGAYHSFFVGDLDGDVDFDIFSCEMEGVPGDQSPKYYIWENVDGKGKEWEEHVILDINLGGHATMVGDVTGNGKLDMLSKPWQASEKNAVNGKIFVLFLENISE
jgi:hypothetical protein